MKNFNDMKPAAATYYLYCMNFDCNISIYNLNLEIGIPLTAENLVANQCCTCCGMALISAIDIEIKKVFTEINTKTIIKHNYLNN